MQRWPLRLVLAVVLGAAFVVPASPAAAGDSSIVRTTNGLVKGTVSTTARSFLGIPFAAPPVGSLRWRAPQPAASWSGVRDATSFGSACAQAPSVLSANGGRGSTSEDCLFLNVYTPVPVRHDLPVLVWIHGGGFVNGSASQYDARVLTAKGHAVIVSINYRLGPFGFLALPGLSAEARDRSSGNFGLQDQQAALHWVRRNVERFGGDAENVTIFGESAGGLAVCANLASPTADDLFQRAITESGPCVAQLRTLATAQATGSAAAAGLGCDASGAPAAQVACMRALPATTVLKAAGGFGPNVGGSVLPQQIPAAIASGHFNRVPVIEGTNHDEDRLFVAIQFDLAGHPIATAAQYAALVQATFGANAAKVLARYPLDSFANGSIAWATVVTDSRFSCPARAADALLSAHVPTFAYEFNDPNAPEFIVQDPVMPLKAFHAAELAFTFQPVTTSGFFTAAQLALSDQMIRYWTTFADEGSPNAHGSPRWPRYRGATDQIQALTPTGVGPVTTFAADHNCAFWASLAA
jgi:para-nitrobenzyl esterase